MKDDLFFEVVSESRLSQALSLRLASKVFETTLTSGIEYTKIYLDNAFMKEYEAVLKEANEVNREATKSADTEELEQLDDQRDGRLTYLGREVDVKETSFDPAIAKAAKRVAVVLDTYKGIQKESYAVESQHVKNLIDDLTSDKLEADLVTLGLTDMVASIQSINNQFEKLMTQREREMNRSDKKRAKELRGELVKYRRRTIQMIQAAWLIQTDEQVLDEIAELAKNINIEIRKVRKDNNVRLGHKGEKDEPETDTEA